MAVAGPFGPAQVGAQPFETAGDHTGVVPVRGGAGRDLGAAVGLLGDAVDDLGLRIAGAVYSPTRGATVPRGTAGERGTLQS